MIVDDHDMVAESLRRGLEREADIDVVAVATTVAMAVDLATTQPPDVVLMDYILPDGSGVDAAATILAAHPGVKILLLTGSDATGVLPAALEVGCVGYLEKTAPLDRLAPAIRSAAEGGLVLSAANLARAVNEPKPSATALTAREQEVLELMAAGVATDAMATRLEVSPVTIRAHVQRILSKLEAHSRLEAVATARERGLLRGR